LTCQGYEQEQHEVCTTFPKLVLNQLTDKTLGDIGLLGRVAVHCSQL
jgi:hypothetical protein